MSRSTLTSTINATRNAVAVVAAVTRDELAETWRVSGVLHDAPRVRTFVGPDAQVDAYGVAGVWLDFAGEDVNVQRVA